jgi:hypothetical protein
VAVSDFRTTHAILRDEAELQALYPGKNIEKARKPVGPAPQSTGDNVAAMRAPAAFGA